MLKRRKSGTQKIVDEVVDASKMLKVEKKYIRFDKVVSTGSTLLDLAIAGKKVRGGGLPGGILVEIYGPSGSGKTSLLAEICTSVQRKGGLVRLRDPESRFDKEYALIYGVNIGEDFFDYARPDTVKEMFSDLWGWEVPEDKINVFGGDSVAALSTELEMEDTDKMGMKQAKEFSQNLRKSARKIGNSNLLTVFTNQLRQGAMSEVTPGGKALEYYASLRIRVAQKDLIEKKIRLASGKEIKKIIGIESLCYVKKSTIDEPYRTAPLSIIFNYGVDSVRDELQWLKNMTGDSKYSCFDKSYVSMNDAITYIEENKLQRKLRTRTIDMWEEIDEKLQTPRQPKIRF